MKEEKRENNQEVVSHKGKRGTLAYTPKGFRRKSEKKLRKTVTQKKRNRKDLACTDQNVGRGKATEKWGRLRKKNGSKDFPATWGSREMTANWGKKFISRRRKETSGKKGHGGKKGMGQKLVEEEEIESKGVVGGGMCQHMIREN